MPKIVEDRVKTLMLKRGMPESKAWAIATASLQREGKLKKGAPKKGK